MITTFPLLGTSHQHLAGRRFRAHVTWFIYSLVIVYVVYKRCDNLHDVISSTYIYYLAVSNRRPRVVIYCTTEVIESPNSHPNSSEMRISLDHGSQMGWVSRKCTASLLWEWACRLWVWDSKEMYWQIELDKRWTGEGIWLCEHEILRM